MLPSHDRVADTIWIAWVCFVFLPAGVIIWKLGPGWKCGLAVRCMVEIIVIAPFWLLAAVNISIAGHYR
jgi:hypothetical protein